MKTLRSERCVVIATSADMLDVSTYGAYSLMRGVVHITAKNSFVEVTWTAKEGEGYELPKIDDVVDVTIVAVDQ